MPEMPIDRSAFTNARRSLRSNEKKLSETAARIVDLRKDLDEANAAGKSGVQIPRLLDRLAAAESEHRRIKDLVATGLADITDRVNRLGEDPAVYIGSLDGKVPVALLPVRIETRFINDDLRIRIFPDQVHLDAHEPELLDTEVAIGRRYWETRWGGGAETRRQAWAEAVATIDPRRGLWVVDQMTPTNVDQEDIPGTSPVFPTPAHKSEDWTRPVKATALPTRWVAIGLQGGKRVFTEWGAPVPEWLATTPTPDPTVDDADFADMPVDEPPGDDPMRWVVDYARALQVGMAITVRPAAVTGGVSTLRRGLDRLVVLGVDWTLTPDAAGNRLDDLFRAHQYTEGFSFLPAGTPTNNTGSKRSGYSESRSELVAQLDPASAPHSTRGTGADLARSLGLRDDAFAGVHGTDLDEATTAGSLQRVLWPATIGHYLSEMMSPLISADDIQHTRNHVEQWLRPGGPYAAVRVGKQPYGVLPVLAHNRFRPDRSDGYEARLHGFLDKLRPMWDEASQKQPRMGQSQDLDSALIKLLQRNPTAMHARYRQVHPAAVAANSSSLARLADAQSDGWLAINKLLQWGHTPPRAAFSVSVKDSRNLWVPFTQSEISDETSPLEPNYLWGIATAANSREGRISLSSSLEPSTLLEALVAHAVVLQFDDTISELLIEHYKIGKNLATELKRSIHHSDTYGLTLRGTTPGGGQVSVSTPNQQANLVVPAMSGNLTMAEHVATLNLSAIGPEQPALTTLKQFKGALDHLASRPAAEIDRAFRGFLDIASHRLDAWATSIATRRLASVRSSRPAGIHIGGYGWVEDLRPSAKPNSLGYIHAPSLAQATTAAILRSGHLSHNDSQALDIQMSSDRVQRAIPILEGVAAGQDLGALLGYRIERDLREHDVRLARYILPLRRLAPLRGPSTPVDLSTPQEAIGARDVVDGITLLRKWRADRNKVLDHLEPPANARAALTRLLNDLDVSYDAVADLLTAEAVYQTTLGNYERAGAAMAAIDRQKRPPDIDVVRTHRTGISYTQKVFAMMGGTPNPAWQSLSNDPRALAAPHVNAWVSHLLPDPTTIRFSGTLRQGSQKVRLEATAADLGISPLSLVMATVAATADRATELEARVAQALAANELVEPDKPVDLSDQPPVDDPSTVGLAALTTLLEWIKDLLTRNRALEASDLAMLGGDRATGVEVARLRDQSTVAAATLNTVTSNLAEVVADPQATVARLKRALADAAGFGVAEAAPTTGRGTSTQIRNELHDLARVIEKELAHRLEGLTAIGPEPEGDETQPTERDLIEHHRARLVTIFGGGFPVIPVFTIPNSDDRARLTATLADNEALTGSDPLVVRSWLDRMGLVRPGTYRLSKTLTASEMLGARGAEPGSVTVGQLPHVANQTWLALPYETPPAGDSIALVLHAPTGIDPTGHLAGVVCDEWAEMIPGEKETTGISFHYDAPGARAPQAILLATPPQLRMASWNLDTLLDTVLEAERLSRYRGVAPQDLSLFGISLPMVYLPHNFAKERPSLDLLKLEAMAVTEFTTVLGKGTAT